MGCSPKTTESVSVGEDETPVVKEETEEVGVEEGITIGCFQPSIKSIFADLEALGYTPISSPAANLLEEAKEYTEEGNYLAAFDKFTEASELDPDNPEIYFWLGTILPATGGPYEVAILTLDEAIEKDQSSEQIIAMFAYRQRGICNVLRNLPESAIADFTECLSCGSGKEEIIPFFFEGVYANRGVAYQYIGWRQFKEAPDDYDKALNFLADALFDYDKAIELAEYHDVIMEKVDQFLKETQKTFDQIKDYMNKN